MRRWYQSAVYQWKQRGNVFLWRYTESIKHYPGWHLSVDRKGGASLLELFEVMKQETGSSERTIQLTPPTFEILQVPSNQEGYARWITSKRLKLQFLHDPESEHQWSLEGDEAKIVLIVGTEHLEQLQKGIEDILHGGGDYSIGNREESKDGTKMRLWFW